MEQLKEYDAKIQKLAPKSLPPPTLKFLQWLKKTDGRDKLYRLIAYGSKIPVALLKDSDPELSQKLKKGASTIGLTRKLLRMFRILNFIQDFLVVFQKNNDIYERLFDSLKACSLAIWMAADHTQWFGKAGYITIGNEKRLSSIHSKAWFFGLFFGVLSSAYKLNKNKSEDKHKKSLVKGMLDVWIPVARLEWLPISDLTVGVCGTLTSCIGINDTWP
jgi:hypothetical protein